MKLEQISSWDLYDNIKNKLNSSIIKSWLLEEGPITQRIKSSYEFKLKLIQDEITEVIDADKKFLNTNSNEIRVREVVLLGDEKPLVYAQTLIPNSTINKGLAELGKIGNKPLGDILFEKDSAEIKFTGKKSVENVARIKSNSVIKILQELCKRNNGKEYLFYYIDNQGEQNNITAENY